MKKKLNFVGIFALILMGFVFACSGENNEKAAKQTTLATSDVVPEENEDTTHRDRGFFDRKAVVYDDVSFKQYQLVRKKGKYCTHFAKTYRGNLFLFQSKLDLFLSNGKFNKNVRFALYDAKGNQLLPFNYEQIGNPGSIADDYVEIRQNGKFGLYNYATKKLIQPEYDQLFPSRIMAYLAIGEKGGKLFKIYEDGTSKEFGENQVAPNYINLLSDFRINYANDQFGMWNDVSGFDYRDEEYVGWELGMFVAPSYLAQIDIYPNLIRGIIYHNDSLDISAKKAVKRSENTLAFIADIYSYVGESRGYSSEEKHLVTVDNVNRKKAHVLILSSNEYDRMNSTENATIGATFINDSLVEVKNYVPNEHPAVPYSFYSKYEYFSIKKNGEIHPLNNGLFPMGSATLLARYHFKGCFARLLSPEESKETPIYDPEMEYGQMFAYSDHLSVSDLAYIRNEIYARHGLRFTDPIITGYFKRFKWYKATKKDVTHLLTETEQKNILTIKKLEKELKSNASKFVHTTFNYYVAAG